MDVYMTIYRPFTNDKGFDDEMEINIEGHYDRDNDSLEILKVFNSFDDKPVELTCEERKKVATEEFDWWLEHSTEAFKDSSLHHEIGRHRDVYWVENEATVVEVEEYDDEVEQCRPDCNCMNCTQARLGRPPFNESTSSKIVRAQNIHAKGGNS